MRRPSHAIRLAGCLTSARIYDLGYGKTPPCYSRGIVPASGPRGRAARAVKVPRVPPRSASDGRGPRADRHGCTGRENKKKKEGNDRAPRRRVDRTLLGCRRSDTVAAIGWSVGLGCVAERASNQSPGLPTRWILTTEPPKDQLDRRSRMDNRRCHRRRPKRRSRERRGACLALGTLPPPRGIIINNLSFYAYRLSYLS